jgi:aspartyl-tRNA(Asn)/glutamyl-tRNA(Gln) amidotransferase subunit C
MKVLKITDSEFVDIEALAKIDLSGEEREKLRIQLERILGFVRILADEKTEEPDETGAAGVIPSPDVPRECLDREEVLAQAPERENGFFRVPPVIEREGGVEK